MKRVHGGHGVLLLLAAFMLLPMLAAEAWAGFTAGPNLAQGRWTHNSILLQNGKVLIVGGQQGNSMLNTAELYDPVTDKITAAKSMAEAHGGGGKGVLLTNGKVLMISGWKTYEASAGGTWSNTVELYNPATDTWTTVAPITTARVGFGTVLLPSGKVLVVGGMIGIPNNQTATAEIYDPVADKWTVAASMSIDRYHIVPIVLANGKILVAGGYNGSSDALTTVEIYDPGTDTWSPMKPLLTARYRGTVTLLANGKVLAAGGAGNPSKTILASAELYDPTSDTWTTVTSLPENRVGQCATLLPNGKLLISGGDGSWNNTAISTKAYLYDVATDTWTLAGTMATPRMEHTATLLANGKLLVSGGLTPGNTYTAATELFDPKHLLGGSIQGAPINVEPAVVSTFAGTAGVIGSTDGTGTAAQFNYPNGITTDGTNLYVVDGWNHTIRKIVLTTGAVTTLAGSAGQYGSSDGIGAAARFKAPDGITTDGTNLYVGDCGNHTIRQVVIATGKVTTMAGEAGLMGSTDGPGTTARFDNPRGITTDGTNLYVTDIENHTIRKVVIATGEVTTLAGTPGQTGSTDGTGTAARFYSPQGVTTDGTNLYVTDRFNYTIRKVVIATSEVTTLAGSPGQGGSTDGSGTAARFSYLGSVMTDGTNLYVADDFNHTIRKVVIATGIVTTLAGKAGTAGATDGIGTLSQFNRPWYITSDGTNLYVADDANHTIRKISAGNLTTGLVAYYPFNGNANDKSGNGHDGVVSGAVLTTDRFGEGSAAYSFDGNSNQISLTNSNNLNFAGPLTISVWAKYSQIQDGVSFISKHVCSDPNGYILGMYASKPHFFFPNNQIVQTSAAMNDNVWHNYIGLYDGTELSFYIDGLLIGKAGNYPSPNTNNVPILIGRSCSNDSPYPSSFHGSIDDIRIYNRALSEPEIQTLYSETPQNTFSVSVNTEPTISAGDVHTVALKNDGTVVAWGWNYYGQTTIPSGLSGVTAIAGADWHTVALKNDGTVVAWGDNSYGQTTIPSGLSGVTAIAAGARHTVALKNDGTVVAWGDNSYGQTTIPSGLTGVTAIAAGHYHNMALKNDGTVVAWGDNSSGQTTIPSGLSGVKAIAGGYNHSVALKNDGTVVAWGYNSSGQTTIPSGLSGVKAIAAGDNHTVALKNDGTVVAWGWNDYGQTTIPSGLSGVVAIAAGWAHTVALKDDGTVVAWGNNTYGQTTAPNGLTGMTNHGHIACASPVINGSASVCTITPDSGYQLATFAVNGVDKLESVSNNSYTLANVQANQSVIGTFAATPKTNQTITFPALPAKTYGDADFAPGATATSGLAVNYSSDTPTVATIVNKTIHIVGAGSALITASQAGNAGYLSATEVSALLTVAKAPLTITAAYQTKGYNSANPALTWTASGFVNGDSASVLSGSPSLSTTALTSSPAGSYPITIETGTLTATNYTFTLVAGSLGITTTAPDAPTLVQALGGNAMATVSFTPPAIDGGAAILGYAVTASPGGQVASSMESPIQVKGLSNGTAYTFTVTATNQVNKTSVASTPSNSVTPATAPSAPTAVTASAGNGEAMVSFTAPADNGGSVITSYTVTASPGGITAKNWTSPITVPGLANGTAYTFTVQATNQVGTGAASAASNSVTPAATITTTTTTLAVTTTTSTSTTTTTSTLPSALAGQLNSTIRIYLADGVPQEYWSINDQIKLKVNKRDAEGNDSDATTFANWTSTDSLLAEVGKDSKGGTVSFKGNGNVHIIATLNGMMDYMDFKVGVEEVAKNYGNLIILAGGKSSDPSDSLKPAIQYLSNRIYQVFKFRGFSDSDIYYINHKADQDFNGDGKADGIVDQTLKSVATLHQAMQWAAEEKNDGPLYLYLMDHGYKNGTLQIESGQVLTATQLDAMLDEFEEATGRTSVVILEACYSGSFVAKLADSDRMIITSSSPEQFSYFSPDGSVSFGQFLSNRLMTGETWGDAFDKAVNDIAKLGTPYAGMGPQKAVGAGVTMGKVCGAFTMGSLFPEIKEYSKGAMVAAGLAQEFLVQLDVADAAGIKVWAMVTPPDYQPPTVSEEFTTPSLGLDKIDLSLEDDTLDYTGSYAFPHNGAYTVTYYVKDSNNVVVSSPPQTFMVSGGEELTTTTTEAVTTTVTSATSTTTTTIPVEAQILLPMNEGWNLLASPIGFDAPTLFGDSGSFTSVWKWVDSGAAGKTWAVYLAGGDGGVGYAASKGFVALTTISPGEGFWLNSKADNQVVISGLPVYGTIALTPGWNLVGIMDDQPLAVSALGPITSAWKWVIVNNTKTWAVSLPAEQDGGASYAASKGFAPLTTFAPGEGFWVNTL